jgi:hypothetical protein
MFFMAAITENALGQIKIAWAKTTSFSALMPTIWPTCIRRNAIGFLGFEEKNTLWQN